MNLGNLIAYLKLDNKQFNAMLTQSQKKMMDTGKKMNKVGQNMSMKLTLPLLAVGTAAFKMSMDFESSMAKITGLVGVAADQVEKWKGEVQRLSAEVGISATEMADALFFITSAGIQGAEAMEVLEMSGKGAAAGLGDAATVADLVTSAMNAYGSDVLSAADATDILTKSVKEGKAEASELTSAMGNVLPMAVAMGVRFDEVGAAIAGMTRTGTEASIASTQLKAILNSLVNPTQEGAEALASMGSSYEDLRTQIKEKGLLSVLETFGDMNKEYGIETLGKVIPNIRAMSGVLDLMGGNAEDNIAIFKSLEDSTGALDAAFESASNTSKHKFETAMAQGKNALISMGDTVKEAFLPIIEILGEALQNLSEWFNDLSPGMKQVIGVTVGLVAALGPLLMGFGKLMMYAPHAISAFKSMGTAIADYGKKVAQFVIANPWLAVAAVLAIVAVKLYNMWKASNKTTSGLDKLRKAQKGVFSDAGKNVVQLQILESRMRDAQFGTKAYTKAVEDYNKVAKEQNLALLDVNKSYDANTEAMRRNKEMILGRAAAQATAAQIESLMAKIMDLRQGQASLEAGSFDWNVAQAGIIGYGKQVAKLMEDQKRYEAFAADPSSSALQYQSPEQAARNQKPGAETVTPPPELDEDTPTPPGTPTTADMDKALQEIEAYRNNLAGIRDAIVSDQERQSLQLSQMDMTDLQRLESNHQQKLESLKEGMEAEVALYEGNGMEQEAIRAKWYSIELTEEEQFQKEKLRLITEAAEKQKAIQMNVLQQFRESVKTREQLEKESYQSQVEQLSALLLMGQVSWQEYFTLLEAMKLQHEERMAGMTQEGADFQSQLIDTLSTSMTQVGEAMGNAFGGAVDAAQQLKSAMGEAAKSIIMNMIDMGIAGAMGNALLTGPAGLIAAPLLAGIVKGMFSAALQGLATGGLVTSGGAFMVGERGPELVNLPRGSAVTPNHMLNSVGGGGDMPYILTTNIKGRDLQIILERADAQQKRRG